MNGDPFSSFRGAVTESWNRGMIQNVRLLLGWGANVDARNNVGATPLHLANNVVVARLLFDRGVSLEARNNDGSTTLHSASNSEVARLLRLCQFGSKGQ